MVAIRLARFGAKKKPTYRVVVMDKRRARNSKTLEVVGHYNPRLEPIELNMQRDRIDYWVGVGAQPSDTVKRLVKYFDEHGANVEAPKREAAQAATAAKPAVLAPVPEKAEEPKPEEAKAEATTEEATPAEEAKAEEPSAEVAPAENATEEAAPAEEAKAEEPAVEAAPADEAKPEEAVEASPEPAAESAEEPKAKDS
jgi:small subunit ribosomal protein S16